ncbi:MAG: hypothetical protein LBR83_08130 [Clostridiales bacterium]|jgi:hypothetical protein|nr:hypothetical protein [Clostridiales bacterium]
MQAIKALYDGAYFRPKQPIPVSGQYEVVITFLEPISTNPIVAKQKQIEADMCFWNEFDKLVVDSSNEVLLLDDFTRNKYSRELILFNNEE